MKKIYKIALISVISVALLLCCTLPAFADSSSDRVEVTHNGQKWWSSNIVYRYVFGLGSEERVFNYYNVPYSQNYFNYNKVDPKISCSVYYNPTISGADAIAIPSNTFVEFDFVFYVTHKSTSSSNFEPVILNSTSSNIHSSVGYNYSFEEGNGTTNIFGIQGLTVSQEVGSDGRIYNHAKGFIHNDTNYVLNVSTLSFSFDSLPPSYAFYVQFSKVYYRFLSDSQFIQEYIVPNVGDVSSDIENAKNEILDSIESSTNEVVSYTYLTYTDIIDKIEALRELIYSNNSSGNDELKQEIQSGNDELKQEIQAGSNQVTDKLDETTDKILNGYESAPVAPSGSSDVTDLGNLESGLQDSASAGIESADEMVTDLGTPMASMLPGFTFFIAMTDRFMQFEWLNTILVVALSLGIVAFLLNISGQILKKVSNGSSSERRSGNSKGKGD